MRAPACNRPDNGFTLVELLLAVSIVIIMSGVLIPGFNRYSNTQILQQAQERAKSDLRNTQIKALSGVGVATGITHWGVKFLPNQDRYGFFTTNSPNATTCNNTTPTDWSAALGGNVLVRGTTTKCVFFSFDNGDIIFTDGGSTYTSCTDSFSCRIPFGYSSSTTCEWVAVNAGGLIREVASAACP